MGDHSPAKDLRGTIVALVTPFAADGSLDEPALERLIEFVLDGGVEGVLACGSTGEKSTLTVDEHKHVIERTVEIVGGRAVVLGETGSNDTHHAVEMAKFAQRAGVDAALSVVPYYNRPTQEGLRRHYLAIAEAIDIPIVVYNIPSRTGVKMTAETLLRLAAESDRIRAVKDATQDLGFTAELLRHRPEWFRVLSGDDGMTLATIAMGGDGIISVIGNETPRQFSDMTRLAMAGDFERARAIYYRLHALMTANFIETNPVPVKAVLAMMGLIEEQYRLPLCPMSAANRERLRAVVADLGLIAK